MQGSGAAGLTSHLGTLLWLPRPQPPCAVTADAALQQSQRKGLTITAAGDAAASCFQVVFQEPHLTFHTRTAILIRRQPLCMSRQGGKVRWCGHHLHGSGDFNCVPSPPEGPHNRLAAAAAAPAVAAAHADAGTQRRREEALPELVDAWLGGTGSPPGAPSPMLCLNTPPALTAYMYLLPSSTADLA